MTIIHPKNIHNARLNVLVAEAKSKSPFYNQLYHGISPTGQLTLKELPLIDHAEYWASYHEAERSVMTGSQNDGVLLKTGGTTGIPKFTSYSQIELIRTTSLLAEGLLHAGLRAGDRVANLFYAGDLYGSFLLHILSVMSRPAYIDIHRNSGPYIDIQISGRNYLDIDISR